MTDHFVRYYAVPPVVKSRRSLLFRALNMRKFALKTQIEYVPVPTNSQDNSSLLARSGYIADAPVPLKRKISSTSNRPQENSGGASSHVYTNDASGFFVLKRCTDKVLDPQDVVKPD